MYSKVNLITNLNFKAMEDNLNFNDLLNLNADDFTEKVPESVLYKIFPKEGKNGTYNALVKFIPWYKDPKNSIITRWEGYLVNPITKRAMTLVCPSSVGLESPYRNMYNRLKYSADPALQQKAEIFSRKPKYYALVQIIKDEVHPEYEGKIKVLKFGSKIYNKIQAELKPPFGEPHLPFDLAKGKPFFIKCKEVAGYPNYDESKFLDQPVSILIDGKMDDLSDIKKVSNFLKENSPDFDEFKFKPWTAEQEAFFNEVVAAVLNVKKLSAYTEDLLKETASKENIDAIQPNLDFENEIDEDLKPKDGKIPVEPADESYDEYNFDDLDSM